MAECLYRSTENLPEPRCTLLGGNDVRRCKVLTFGEEECPVALFKLRQINFDEANLRLVRLKTTPLVDSLNIRTAEPTVHKIVNEIDSIMFKYGQFLI